MVTFQNMQNDDDDYFVTGKEIGARINLWSGFWIQRLMNDRSTFRCWDWFVYTSLFTACGALISLTFISCIKLLATLKTFCNGGFAVPISLRYRVNNLKKCRDCSTVGSQDYCYSSILFQSLKGHYSVQTWRRYNSLVFFVYLQVAQKRCKSTNRWHSTRVIDIIQQCTSD